MAESVPRADSTLCPTLGPVSRGKTAVLLDFHQMRGGERALPKFFGTFHESIFGQLKKSISSEMPII